MSLYGGSQVTCMVRCTVAVSFVYGEFVWWFSGYLYGEAYDGC